jgi:anti-sigma factor ChrR (cupin superfamily)
MQLALEQTKLSPEEIAHSNDCTLCIGRVRDAIISQFLSRQPTPGDDEPKVLQFSPMQTVRKEDQQWEETPFPGVQVCRLFVDGEGNGSLFINMQPGAVYPAHEHGGREQFYVVSGDMRIGPALFKAGDYHRAEAGTVHETVSTIGGCSCLVVGYIGIAS